MQIGSPSRDPTGWKSGHSRSHRGPRPLPIGKDRDSYNTMKQREPAMLKEERGKKDLHNSCARIHRRSFSCRDCGRMSQLTQSLFIRKVHVSVKALPKPSWMGRTHSHAVLNALLICSRTAAGALQYSDTSSSSLVMYPNWTPEAESNMWIIQSPGNIPAPSCMPSPERNQGCIYNRLGVCAFIF